MTAGADTGQQDLLEESLVKVLAGKLGPLAAAADLDEAALLEQARGAEDEILAGVESQWGDWAEAKSALKALELSLPVTPLGKTWRRFVIGIREGAPGELVQSTEVAVSVIGFALLAAFTFLVSEASSPSSFFKATAVLSAIVAPIVAVPLFVYFVPLRPSESELRRAEVEARAAERSYFWRLNGVVAGWVRSRINITEGLSYATKLRFKDASGLGEVDDPSHEISTKTRKRLASLIDRMPGGAIGLAGARGAGKSTLMRSICAGAESDELVFGVVVDAPVQYEAREFVLHLFARLCEEALGKTVRARTRREWRPLDTPGLDATEQEAGYHPVIGLVLAVVGAMLLISSLDISLIGLSGNGIAGIVLIMLGYALGMHSLIQDGPRVRRLLRIRGRDAADPEGNDDDDELSDIAEQRLQQIQFQQSFSSGWSGSLKIPIGLEGGFDTSTELSEQQMSLPDVVDQLRRFLEAISEKHQVRIGIDELDKMPDQAAHQFLNEIKAIFRVPRCFSSFRSPKTR